VIWDNILTKLKEKQKEFILEDSNENFSRSVRKLTLSEFSKRNMALLVSSAVLNENVWFCSNEEMVKKIKQDDPESVCYLGNELEELLRINPEGVSLENIHRIKSMFKGSIINQY